ncbi:MAG: DUF305 domain-containing protein [Actinobacteria bacterium]|uniref:Unannotated protein n=1 Tax=freshwater metagenome TaxID=449393 RepID=A0A6J7GII7_9ZZZZ|nr:DUF305 domain-containing protein [Actinomycetota bacterium]MTB27676.1 DUF305 domain-containing protein [Actinomycetota bacterium]
MVLGMRTRLIAIGFTATVLAGVLTACGSETVVVPTAMPMMTTASPSVTANTRADDIAFAQLMIEHHQQAIEMANMALSQADSNEVKDLADQIREAQDPEINTMREWLTSWGAPEAMNNDNMSGMHMDGLGMMTSADMETLSGLSGPGFDRMWLQMMIQHHEGAISMANDVLATTTDAGVKTLAQSIIDGQSSEIATMKTLQTNGE